MRYLKKVKERIKALPQLHSEAFVPCTQQEVEALQQRIGRPLPAAYQEFLLWMGHSAGRMFAGSHYSYPVLPALQQGARELLQEDGFPQALPEDAFVFFMHQGYQFSFFRLSEGDDPPIYDYLEMMPSPTFREPFEHFSEFLLACLEDYVAIRQDMARKIAEVFKINPALGQRMADEARKRGDYDDTSP